jgi:DNA-binding beta-propeller fold protein YncE
MLCRIGTIAVLVLTLGLAGRATPSAGSALITIIGLNSQAPSSLIVAANTRTLLVAGTSTKQQLTLTLVGVDSHKVLTSLTRGLLGSPSPSLALSERTKRAFVTAGYTFGSPETGIVDTATGRFIGTVRSTHAAGRPTAGTSYDVGQSAVAVDDHLDHLFVLNRVTVEDKTDNSVAMLDTTTGDLLHLAQLGAKDVPVAEALSAKHDLLYVAADWSNRVYTIDARNGSIVRSTAVGANPCAVAVDAVDDRVVVVNEAAPTSLSVLDGATGRLLKTIPLGVQISMVPPCSLAVDDRTGNVFVPGQGSVKDGVPIANGRIAMVDVKALRRLLIAVVGVGPIAEASSHSRLVVANYGNWLKHAGGSISILDSSSGRVISQLAVAGNPTAVAADERTGQVFVSLERGANGTDGAIAVLRL